MVAENIHTFPKIVMATAATLVGAYNVAAELLETGNESGAEDTLRNALGARESFGCDGGADVEAKVLVLLGKLIEWKNAPEALALYKKALALCRRGETLCAQARLSWKLATLQKNVDDAGAALKTGWEWCVARDEEGTVDEDEFQECGLLYARYLSQRPACKREFHVVLSELGYEYTIAHSILSGNSASLVEMPPSSECPAFIVDDALSDEMLAHMQRSFAPESPYYSDHRYGSPSTGFFSNQISLAIPASTTLERAIHMVWKTSSMAYPALKNAEFAEFWAHQRSFTSGHGFHYDITKGPAAKKARHPIASTVLYLTAEADVGGPTLVLDATESSDGNASAGWLAYPKLNRILIFKGQHMHAVMPGAIPPPSASIRRITFMVSFYSCDPGAPTYSSVSVNVPWKALADSPLPETAHARKTHPKTKAVARIVDPLWEAVQQSPSTDAKNEDGAARSAKRPRRTCVQKLNFMQENVYAHFQALDSGILVGSQTTCSLNCGGGCDECRGFKKNDE